MTIEGGYILQPRCIDGSSISKMPPVTREIWLYILRKVNHKDSDKFKRGTGLFSYKEIQESLSWYVGYRKETYSKPQIAKSLRRLSEGNAIGTAKATRGVFITVLNYTKYQDPKNYERNNEEIPKEPRKKRKGSTINKNDKNKEEEKSTSSGNGKFIKPNLEQVREYCLERKNGINPEAFLNHYEAKGWMIGKNKMKNWKAAIRTWENSNAENRGNNKKSGFKDARGQGTDWLS